jgi:hypothetical protein
MDYHQLRLMTLAQLRETAAGIEGLTGSTQMRKEQLLKAICEHLRIPMHDQHEVVGIDKTALKQRIRALKRERDEALGAHDPERLKLVRRRLHRLKRRIHRATV